MLMKPFVENNIRVAFVMGDKDLMGNIQSGMEIMKFINSYSTYYNFHNLHRQSFV